MDHIIVVGLCYLDTILSVPHYPEEDSKLRATDIQVRRGGNCGNTLEVLQQLVRHHGVGARLHLLSPLPDASSPATAQIIDSFGPDGEVDVSLCPLRAGHMHPASSHIVRSVTRGSRTIVSHNPLPEMTAGEFARAAAAFETAPGEEERRCWWHFEGRIPQTTIQCIRHVRRILPTATVSVEVEKPGREGLAELAAEADVVFYSRSWAEAKGYRSADECLAGEAPSSSHASYMFATWGAQGASALALQGQERQGCCCAAADVVVDGEGEIRVVDTVGAGDTFIAGIVFGLSCRRDGWDLQTTLRFAVGLATRKVQIEGLGGLLLG